MIDQVHINKQVFKHGIILTAVNYKGQAIEYCYIDESELKFYDYAKEKQDRFYLKWSKDNKKLDH